MITIKQYAAAMAAIDAGKYLPEVIAAFELDLAGWQAAEEHWRGHLQAQAIRGERAAADQYVKTYNRQRAVVERELSESEANAGDTAAHPVCTREGDTAPLLPLPAGSTEPMSAEALAAFQASIGNEYAALPFKPDDWTLERYATLEEQMNHHPGAIAAVLAQFGLDFDQYRALRGRFAALLQARRCSA